MKKTATKPKSNLYQVSVIVLGKKYEAKAKTVYDALQKLEPGTINGKVILTVSKGKESKERVIPTVSARRMFNTAGIAQETQMKVVSSMFQGI